MRSCPDAIIHPEFTLSAVERITACRAPSASTVTLAEGGTNITNRLIRARDGIEALDYLFGRGQHADRDVSDLPVVTLLDLNLLKVSGLEVLKAIRANECTKHLPIVILTSSNEDKDRLGAYDHFANSYVIKPVDYEQFVALGPAVGSLRDGLECPCASEGNIAKSPKRIILVLTIDEFPADASIGPEPRADRKEFCLTLELVARSSVGQPRAAVPMRFG